MEFWEIVFLYAWLAKPGCYTCRMKRIVKLSYLYSLASVFIGPAIVFLLPWPKNGGCYDYSWGVGDVHRTPLPLIEALYGHGAGQEAWLATILALLGICLFGCMLYAGYKTGRLYSAVAPAMIIVAMIYGYSVILSIAASRWC